MSQQTNEALQRQVDELTDLVAVLRKDLDTVTILLAFKCAFLQDQIDYLHSKDRNI